MNLKQCTKHDVVSFSLQCESLRECKAVDVYDGDTCTLAFHLDGLGYRRCSCRLYGIDTCEMRGGTQASKNYALKAKNRLVQLLLGSDIQLDKAYTKSEIQTMVKDSSKTVQVDFKKHDKYGNKAGLVSWYAWHKAARFS